MLHWLKEILDERSKDCLQVLLPNGAVLAAINLTHINQWVSLFAGLLTVGYAAWRWRRDSFVLCNACRDGHPPDTCPYPKRKRPAWCPRNF